MGAKENLDIVAAMQQAAAAGDYDTWGSYLADDAVFRAAGVPASMGGVTTGRQAIVELVSNGSGGSFDVKDRFADDDHVCVVGKVHATGFSGNDQLKGADKPYTTYQCTVYRLADGKVAESTSYVNWLDPYVQMGLVDPSSFIRR
jgi:ketosteroid isomerase-like protein